MPCTDDQHDGVPAHYCRQLLTALTISCLIPGVEYGAQCAVSKSGNMVTQFLDRNLLVS